MTLYLFLLQSKMNKKYQHHILLAGIPVSCAFRFPETASYLHSVIQDNISGQNFSKSMASVDQQEFDSWAQAGNSIDAFAEFCLLCMPVSESLLESDCCVFHAAAISFHGQAWLIAAGSGVGKSTQCRTLFENWPEEISVINGDKPVLQACEDGTVMVCPSPWNGKEGWHGAAAAPLAGIFLLRRGAEDSLVPIKKKDVSAALFTSVFHSYKSERIIRQAAAMTEKIANSCPIWLLTSCQILDSANLLYACMTEEMKTHVL